MTYEEWEATVPKVIAEDSLWRMKAYRLALFLADVAWEDCARLRQDRRTVRTSDQLYRAVGGISAEIAEGYSRQTGRDRAHFYEYALGSARESRDWYFKIRHILGEIATENRLELLTEIIRLLLTMVPQQRGHMLSDVMADYEPTEG